MSKLLGVVLIILPLILFSGYAIYDIGLKHFIYFWGFLLLILGAVVSMGCGICLLIDGWGI